MKSLLSIAVIITLTLAQPLSAQSLQISNIQWPQLNYTMCTQSDIYVNLIRSCYNSTYSGATVVVNGLTITLDVNYTVTGSCNSILDFPGHQISLGILPAGTYAVTVNAVMNSVLQSSMASSLTVSMGNCCQSVADAGNNATICDTSGYQLNGNTPPPFATAGWTLALGSGMISNPTLPNATISNLAYGINKFAWSMSDTACSTSDTVTIRNYEKPTTSVTEANKFSCYDSITINANVPLVGIGTWKSLTSGINIFQKNDAKTLLTSLKPLNLLTWTINNGVCPSSVDTLKIDYSEVTTAPVITVNGLTLNSDAAPSYQWYKDGNPIANETNQIYQVTANGLYSVYAVVPGCDNGLFSNEIEFKSVGIDEKDGSALRLYPNPTSGTFFIEKEGELSGEIVVYNMQGGEVYNMSVQSEARIKVNLPSNLNSGTYYLSFRESDGNEVRVLFVNN